MATLQLYHKKFRLTSKTKIVEQRRELLKIINGGTRRSFPLKSLPRDMQVIFWAKNPIGDGLPVCCDNFLSFWHSSRGIWSYQQSKQKPSRVRINVTRHHEAKGSIWVVVVTNVAHFRYMAQCWLNSQIFIHLFIYSPRQTNIESHNE